jgi:hypothetical protein
MFLSSSLLNTAWLNSNRSIVVKDTVVRDYNRFAQEALKRCLVQGLLRLVQ